MKPDRSCANKSGQIHLLRSGRHGYGLPKDSLSPRETEVCKLLTKGLLLKEVALQLGISIHTAGGHTQNAYVKLRVHNRAGLVTRFAAELRSRGFPV
jgi:DNA-binding CsgD family transcriptional regulator